mgnify:FL=1
MNNSKAEQAEQVNEKEREFLNKISERNKNVKKYLSPSMKVVCTDQYFFEKNIQGIGFSNTIFTRLVASIGSRFINVDFSYCVFDHAYLRGCAFENCNFTGVKFINSNFLGASFTKCNFEYALFDKTVLDDDFSYSNLPDKANLRQKVLRSLRINYQQLGDSQKVNEIILLELEATKEYLFKASFSDDEYYSKKYKGFQKRGLSILRLVGFTFLNIIWGNGEKLKNLLISFLIILICIIAYDMSMVSEEKADSIRYLFSSIQNAPIIFFTNNFPEYYADFAKMLIVFLRLFMFALFTSILFKRLNRR